MNIRWHQRFRGMIQAYRPDTVVSMHPLGQEVPLRVLERMGKRKGAGKMEVVFVTVVTDPQAAHPTWFHPNVDAVFVRSERLATLARKSGLNDDQI
ncbi:unnamed protein product, partial [Laminaria digitata]